MDFFEINKIIGAVLFSVLVILGVGIVTGSIFDVRKPAQPGYVIAGTEQDTEEESVAAEAEPVEEEAQEEQPAEPSESAAVEPEAEGEDAAEAPQDEQAASPEAAGDSELLQRIAAGDVEAGRRAARKCAACHTFDEGGSNRVGPNLFDSVGSEVAADPSFSYSSALRELGGTWDYERLDTWIERPRDLVPRTSMAFAGIRNEKERADLIAYMRSLSPNAPPLP